MNKTAVVTGAGSGVGQAIALKLAKKGWRVALIGRRKEKLQATAKLAGKQSTKLLICPCDIANPKEVANVGRQILRKFGHVEVLVNSAATNAPKRSLAVLSLEDYHAMITTNLNGAYYCVQAFLPEMRAARSGTIINIVSESGKQASSKSGPGYVMSKFGLTGLTQSINVEERANGVRACAIFPGDIDTQFLNMRPQPPDAVARTKMLRSEDVADCAMFSINLPPHVMLEEMLVRPR